MRTGNVLFKKCILDPDEEPFDNNFGLSGGEDAVFFARKVASGYTFAWCNEARVYEEVTKDRQTFKYHLQRSIIRGVTSADDNCLFSKDTMKSLCAVVLYAISLPVLLICGYHLFIKHFIKLFDHFSKILARCGIFISRERSF
jgi:hypothetical protein